MLEDPSDLAKNAQSCSRPKISTLVSRQHSDYITHVDRAVHSATFHRVLISLFTSHGHAFFHIRCYYIELHFHPFSKGLASNLLLFTPFSVFGFISSMYWVICYVYFLSLSSALLTQQREGREVFVRDGICGTETPSAALKDAHKRLASTKDSQRVANTDGKPKNIEVETYFHVVSTKDQVDLVTNEMIASQVCLTACILLYSQANKQPVCLPRTRICQYKHQL